MLQLNILGDSLEVQAYVLDFLLGSVPTKKCTAQITIFSRKTGGSFAMHAEVNITSGWKKGTPNPLLR